MTFAYWIVAGMLAAFYLYSGGLKVTRSKDQLRPMMQWVDGMPLPMIRTIGALELLGAIGLILPPLFGIAPMLATLAAMGLALIQFGAITLHLLRQEADQIWLNIVLLTLAIVTIWLATSLY